jgi:hypothetical protein
MPNFSVTVLGSVGTPPTVHVAVVFWSDPAQMVTAADANRRS